jgi:hypothetical protein
MTANDQHIETGEARGPFQHQAIKPPRGFHVQTTAQNTTVHPIGEAADLGVWTITVTDVVAGDEAASLMAEANGENPAPLDGLVYLCAKITAQNTSDIPRSIQMVDFAATGSDGVLRRTWAVVVPEPMLQAVVEPGASTEGWIAVTVDDPSAALLWFDSPILGGNWSNGLFALADGASAPDAGDLAASGTDVGADPASPAAFGETVTVGGWEVTVDEARMGVDQIWELFDFQTQALTESDDWINRGAAVHATVRNLNPFPAFFSEIAFEICDWNGEPWDHTLMLTIPDATDVSREYMPGASGDGWTAFGGQVYTEYNLLRVAPNRLGGEFRYYTFGGDPGEAATAEEEPDATAESEAPPLEVAVGDVVETSEDLVNLREDASTTGEIVRELPLGTQLEVTGDPVEADGYTWVPVTLVDGDESGYVVADFVTLATD